MMLVLLLLTIGALVHAQAPLKKAAHLTIKNGEEITIESPNYPNVPPMGTNITWNIKSDSDTKIQLMCEDLRIAPSNNCEKGHLLVNDGLKEEKFCGSENGLTIKSVSNRMKVQFVLIWAGGVAKCLLKGEDEKKHATVVPDNTSKPIEHAQIQLVPGGAAYDFVHMEFIYRNYHKKWKFATTSGSRINFHCNSVRLSGDCLRSYLQISGDTNKMLCNMTNNYNMVTNKNTLEVELKTTDWHGGRIDCLVQAVTGVKPFQYRNIISAEVDSTEYGNRAGPKKTDCKCGWSVKSPARIVNGQKAREGQYPWVVSLKQHGHFCGGSIITEYHVLTAAHCTVGKNASAINVYVGTTNNANVRQGQIVKVKRIIDHAYQNTNLHKNDISILLLENKIKFNDFIGPVCLTPNRVPLDHMFITVMGWGALGNEGKWVNPKDLMRAHMRVVDYNTCNYLWYRKFNTVAPSRVCTWASNRDSCFGDSGGPLVWLDPETNRYTQVGLVSFGRGCNTDFPKVNSNVAHFYPWIQQIVNSTMPEVHTCTKI